MMSQSGQERIEIHILPKISGSKNNHTMKLCQLADYNKRNILFLKNYAENEAGRQVSDLFLFFKYS